MLQEIELNDITLNVRYHRCCFQVDDFSKSKCIKFSVQESLPSTEIDYWYTQVNTHYKTKFHLYFTFTDFFKSLLNRQAGIWILYGWHMDPICLCVLTQNLTNLYEIFISRISQFSLKMSVI